MENTDLLQKMQKLAIIKGEFKALKTTFDEETADIQDRIKEIEAEIETEIINRGESVKSEYIDAIYNKGRESWDGKILKGYAVAHPEILAARKIGNPTVSFRLKNQK